MKSIISKILFLFFVCFVSLSLDSARASQPPKSIHKGPYYSNRIQAKLDAYETKSTIQASIPEQLTLIFEGNLPPGLSRLLGIQGGALRFSSRHGHELSIPIDKFPWLLDILPSAGVLRLPFPHSADVTTEGATITGALDMHDFGHDGTGISIGVIDLGFASLATSQAAGELPTGLTITDYTGTGTGGTTHGTNVAEIVHDMAPGAELFLAKISTISQLETALTDMAAAGVRVINHSVGWYGVAFYDGTGAVCEITNDASNGGILWVNSAGNSRLKHYLATFNDQDGNLRHEFSTGQNYNTMTFSAGTSVTIVLNWDDYSAVDIDYDLYLYDGDPSSGGTIVAQSTNIQGTVGNKFPYPYEALEYTSSDDATYYIVIEKENSSTSNVPLTLFSLGPNLDIRTQSTSLNQPADSAHVLTVGATQLDDSPEYFSSEGPTTDGRQKPDLSGPDRVLTSLTSSFAGTSAAAPHIAGAAGLLLSQNQGLSVTQLKDALILATEDVHNTGFDSRTGYGRLSLDADGDDWNHDHDNCPIDSNVDQLDTDADLTGDACDLDDDNDGLLDTLELTIGTDPLLQDSDGDSLDDLFEISFDGDPLTYNSETDLNPLSSDTDGDSVSDFDEINFDGDPDSYNPGVDLNPISSDTDGDGFNDGLDPLPLLFHFLDGDIAPHGEPDGVINAADFTLALRLLLGDIPLSEQELIHGDLYPSTYPDGIFNLSDVLLIYQQLQ